jgi:valyl-tRNA synthetase
MAKPPYGTSIHQETLNATTRIFEKLLQVLHPFMPFITEEIWGHLAHREPGTGSICVAPWPHTKAVNENIQQNFEHFAEVVNNVRNIRKSNQIANKDAVELLVIANENHDKSFDGALQHLCNISALQYVYEKVSGAFGFIVGGNEYFVPFTANVDVEAERKKLQDDLEYTRGFLNSVEAKLNNEKFANNAPPQVLEGERKKQSDALSKIKMLEEKLATLN